VLVLYDDVFNWFTKMCLSPMRQAALAMIRQARAAGVRVVVSGHDAADAPEVYLQGGAEFVVIGEGELTLGELLARMSQNGNGGADGASAGGDAGNGATTARPAPVPAVRYDDIPGLVFTHLGMQRRTGPRALLKELDELPTAAWDLVDIPRYRDFWTRRHGYFSLNLVTTRGLPLSVQLVREAGLRQHLSHSLAGSCRRGDSPAANAVRARSPLVLRRHLRAQEALVDAVRRPDRRRGVWRRRSCARRAPTS